MNIILRVCKTGRRIGISNKECARPTLTDRCSMLSFTYILGTYFAHFDRRPTV